MEALLESLKENVCGTECQCRFIVVLVMQGESYLVQEEEELFFNPRTDTEENAFVLFLPTYCKHKPPIPQFYCFVLFLPNLLYFQFSSLYKFTGRIYCAIISAAAYDSFFFSFYCDSLSRFPTGAHFQLFLYRPIFQPREASFFAIFTATFRSTLDFQRGYSGNKRKTSTHTQKKPSLRIVLSMVW